MELIITHLSLVQLAIFLLIIVGLFWQRRAIKKGKMVAVSYSLKQKLFYAVIVSLPMMLAGLIIHNWIFVLFGAVIGVLCYKNKSWYKLKST